MPMPRSFDATRASASTSRLPPGWRNRIRARAVFVDVPGNARRRELANLIGACDRAAEDQDGQRNLVNPRDRPHQIDPAGVRQAKIQHDQVDVRAVGADALRDERTVATRCPAPSRGP